LNKFMTKVPAQFTVGLVNTSNHQDVVAAIRSAYTTPIVRISPGVGP
jgi:hypothetical protein